MSSSNKAVSLSTMGMLNSTRRLIAMKRKTELGQLKHKKMVKLLQDSQYGVPGISQDTVMGNNYDLAAQKVDLEKQQNILRRDWKKYHKAPTSLKLLQGISDVLLKQMGPTKTIGQFGETIEKPKPPAPGPPPTPGKPSATPTATPNDTTMSSSKYAQYLQMIENSLKTPEVMENPALKTQLEESKEKINTIIKSEKSDLLSAKTQAENIAGTLEPLGEAPKSLSPQAENVGGGQNGY